MGDLVAQGFVFRAQLRHAAQVLGRFAASVELSLPTPQIVWINPQFGGGHFHAAAIFAQKIDCRLLECLFILPRMTVLECHNIFKVFNCGTLHRAPLVRLIDSASTMPPSKTQLGGGAIENYANITL
jgi:hypothetical protein